MMKQIAELLHGIEHEYIAGDGSAQVRALTYDSRKVEAGDCFFACEGSNVDGHNYIDKAIAAGASVVVCRRTDLIGEVGNCTIVKVADTDKAMALMASAYYGHPSHKMKVVGVTGTNGKTTIATLLYDLVRLLGHKAGLISTVVYKIDEREVESTHTTPDAIRLNAMMREMVDCGCEYCFMECSSHSIVQRRIYGIDFTGALFTNLTHDHLDYHKTFIEYVRAKKGLFDELSSRAFALVNTDDRNGEVMLQNTAALRQRLSMRNMADFRCKIIERAIDGMLLDIDGCEVWVQFLGRFNAYNLLTVYGAARLLGFEREELLCAISALRPVCGRFDIVRATDSTMAIIDYAHTPDALENVLRTIDEIRSANQRVIAICGCGGERDRTKRPEMAAIAVKYADTSIFTSDNPRSENPEDILRDMEAGIEAGSHYMKIADREQAIKTAILIASPGDIILVAGKGHENYQIVGTERLPFNDRQCVEQWFKAFNR